MRSRPEVARYFLDWRAIAVVARGRLWNYGAPASDQEVLGLTRSAI
jgi:hypothetical protein